MNSRKFPFAWQTVKYSINYAKIQTLALALTIPGTSHLTALYLSFLSSGQGLFNEEQ